MFERFLAKEFEKGQAIKRGGRVTQFSIDPNEGEERYAAELADERTPDRVFEQQWAMTVLHRSVDRLRDEFTEKGKQSFFDECRSFLTGGLGDSVYADVARRLQMSEGALRVAVHRLRERFRDLLRQEVAGTVASEQDVDDELIALRKAIAGQG